MRLTSKEGPTRHASGQSSKDQRYQDGINQVNAVRPVSIRRAGSNPEPHQSRNPGRFQTPYLAGVQRGARRRTTEHRTGSLSSLSLISDARPRLAAPRSALLAKPTARSWTSKESDGNSPSADPRASREAVLSPRHRTSHSRPGPPPSDFGRVHTPSGPSLLPCLSLRGLGLPQRTGGPDILRRAPQSMGGQEDPRARAGRAAVCRTRSGRRRRRRRRHSASGAAPRGHSSRP